jgi:C4-dicarboxylate-specific signal transduction histidine kinase
VCAPENLNRLSEVIDTVKEYIRKYNEEIFKHCSVTPHIVLTSLAPDNDAAKELVLSTLRESMNDIKDALVDLDVAKIRNLLQSTKHMADVIADPAARDAVMDFQKEARDLCTDISKALKEVDGNVQLAAISLENNKGMKSRISKFVF